MAPVDKEKASMEQMMSPYTGFHRGLGDLSWMWKDEMNWKGDCFHKRRPRNRNNTWGYKKMAPHAKRCWEMELNWRSSCDLQGVNPYVSWFKNTQSLNKTVME